MSVTRAQVVDEARSWLGTPFKHQGRTRAGIDCVGLCVMVARGLDLSNYDITAYENTTHQRGFLQHFDANAWQLQLTETQPGDMVVFTDPVHPCHVGILSERFGVPYVIHAVARLRVVCETPYAGNWERCAVAAYAYPGLV